MPSTKSDLSYYNITENGTQKCHRHGANYYKAIFFFLFLCFQDSSLEALHFALRNK